MVASLESNSCSERETCEKIITMPLLDDLKATLKADLDVTRMNTHLKAYIEQEIQKGIEAAMSDKMESLLDKKMATTNKTIETSVQHKLKDIGVTYVRWARKSCPDDTELVYTGQAGGNHPLHKGGGSNYLCLPNDPENGQFQPHDNHVLFGVEYQTFYNSKPHGWSNSLGNKELPCAVCHRKKKSSVLMIPGRKTCYNGWTAEYSGYILSTYKTQNSMDYICGDKDAEPFDGRSTDDDQALVYGIRTACGSLRCPTYTKYADVQCVVCTK